MLNRGGDSEGFINPCSKGDIFPNDVIDACEFTCRFVSRSQNSSELGYITETGSEKNLYHCLFVKILLIKDAEMTNPLPNGPPKLNLIRDHCQIYFPFCQVTLGRPPIAGPATRAFFLLLLVLIKSIDGRLKPPFKTSFYRS